MSVCHVFVPAGGCQAIADHALFSMLLSIVFGACAEMQ